MSRKAGLSGQALIYACGLRLSECLGLTIHDIDGTENKLFIRDGKGQQDRVLPLPTSLYEELRRYRAFHRHPLLIFCPIRPPAMPWA